MSLLSGRHGPDVPDAGSASAYGDAGAARIFAALGGAPRQYAGSGAQLFRDAVWMRPDDARVCPMYPRDRLASSPLVELLRRVMPDTADVRECAAAMSHAAGSRRLRPDPSRWSHSAAMLSAVSCTFLRMRRADSASACIRSM